MDFNISGQNTKVTDGLDAAIREKFKKLEGHAPNPLRAHVVLHVDANQHRVDAMITGIKGKPFIASSAKPDMYAAINDVARVLDKQLNKFQQKQVSIKRSTPGLKNTF